MLDPGTLVNDRYRLDATIAAGGMGQVWRATDTVLGRTVAVKLLRHLTDDTARVRFRNEARAMAALRDPGVAGVYDYGETALPDGTPVAFIVMACVEGQPLSRRIAEAGRLEAAETASVVAQAARALQAVHDAGVVHRDVKPGNLIVEPDGTVVLIDFGVAVTADAAAQTRADEVVGTALYMAPEQVTKGELTAATDVYALGAVAYHCLAGRPPFTGDNAVTVALSHLQDEPDPLPEDVPESLCRVVTTAMAKDPALRYPTAAALADAVESGRTEASTTVLAARAPLPAAPVTVVDEPPPPVRRRRRTVGALIVGAVALLVVFAVADPTGIIPLPGEPPRVPAATRDAPASADPDQPRQGDDTSADPPRSPGSVVATPAGDTAPEGGDDGGAPADGGDPGGEPEPTPTAEPSAPSESSPPPASDDETASADPDPDPTAPADDEPEEPALPASAAAAA
ncbi:protein kinase [Asanoa sp. NPDC049518]|uniref:serine/threonine-protein kinase n=1 Tax=unclassified Asanoa TaxID=2685164 RepID=UPI003447A28C